MLPLLCSMSLISPNFDVKSIIFSQFWPGSFSQNCWKKPWFLMQKAFPNHAQYVPGCIAQSVTCLDCICMPDCRSRGIPARSYTSVEIDHEIISTVIFSLLLIQEGLLSVTSESMCKKYWLTAFSSLRRKKCVR